MKFWDLFRKSKTKEVISPQTKSDKERATEEGRPYVTINRIEIDPNQPHSGKVEIDYNDKFVQLLQAHGYQGRDHDAIVDQWFTAVCRHILLETWEKEEADRIQIQKRDVGDGRTAYE